MLLQLPYFEDLLPYLTRVGQDCPFTLGLGVFMAQAVVFGSLTARVAVSKGHRGGAWFARGFFLSFVGLGMARMQSTVSQRFTPPALGKTPRTYDPCPCPKCGASLHPCAGECNRCGYSFEGARPSSEVARATE